jgi:hypothetical protein
MNRPIKIYIFSLIYVLIFLSSSTLAANSQCDQSPDCTARSFYIWYIDKIENNVEPLYKCKTTLSKYISRSLLIKIYKWIDDENQEATFLNDPDFYGSLNADYFIKSQDILNDWAKNITTTQTKIKKGVAVTIVTLGATNDTRRNLTVSLKRESNKWKIVAIQKGAHPLDAINKTPISPHIVNE